ncbi:MAG: hypothetical protein IPN69_19190 [Acidobacteria bacterium]|nr:hypothetical protein [Acidobacteriota bacterium]
MPFSERIRAIIFVVGGSSSRREVAGAFSAGIGRVVYSSPVRGLQPGFRDFEISVCFVELRPQIGLTRLGVGQLFAHLFRLIGLGYLRRTGRGILRQNFDRFGP